MGFSSVHQGTRMLAFRQRQFVIVFPQPLHVQRDPVGESRHSVSHAIPWNLTVSKLFTES
jgi:hypothetical protein